MDSDIYIDSLLDASEPRPPGVDIEEQFNCYGSRSRSSSMDYDGDDSEQDRDYRDLLLDKDDLDALHGRDDRDSRRERDDRDFRHERENRNSQQEREGRNSRPVREVRDSRLEREVRDSRLEREVRDSRLEREIRDSRLEREVCDSRLEREVRDSRLERDVRDPRLEREVRDSRLEREVRDSRLEREVRDSRLERAVGDSRLEKEVRDSTLEREDRETKREREDSAVRPERDERNSRDEKDDRDTRHEKDIRDFRHGKDVRDSRNERIDHNRNTYTDERRSSRHDAYHNRKEYDSRYERRNYRDRSRDYERDRSRDHDRDRSRDHERERPRERPLRDFDRDKTRDFRGEEIPHSTILVKGMEPHITVDDIRNEIARYSLHPKEVTLMRKRHTGESRGFAYVEFQMLSDAVRWKELTQGVIYFGTARATLHYYIPRESLRIDRTAMKVDWTCIKCGVNNFRKRDMCFKCNAPREEAELTNIGGEGYDEVSHSATSTLLFRNLDILTTEERVLTMLGQITVLPIKNLKVAKDTLTHTSRGFAYVELHSISEAMQLHDLLLSISGNFYVDGRRVTVSYSRRSLTSMNSAASADAASAALAAAQWTNQKATNKSSMFSDSSIQERQAENTKPCYSKLDIINQPKYSTPNTATFQYDETSGFYYDSVTGFYYDPNSQYYYNAQTRQYLYWDAEKQTYLSVPSSTPAVTTTSTIIEASAIKTEPTESKDVVITSPPVITHAPVLSIKKEPEIEKVKEKGSQDKVKIAKRVAKDMAKWAKTLNQKKENAKTFVPPPPVKEEPKSKIEVTLKVEITPEATKNKIPDVKPETTLGLAGIQAYGGESDSEVESEYDECAKALDFLKAEEAKLIDWDKLACLLCKRQFPSKEVLTKHVQLSDLHKQNVNMLKLTKLTPKQLLEIERKESGYRDRAKERRQKFGQPDLPPPSKLKTKYLKEKKEAFLPPEEPAEPLGSDNIGNKMLKAMGWTEGQGLGKKGQGMSGIIEVQRRVKSAGLGMKGASYGASASDSYKDAVRKAMQARYNDVA